METLGLPGIHIPVVATEDDPDNQHTPLWVLDLVAQFWPASGASGGPGPFCDPCWHPQSLVRAPLTYDGSCAEQDGLSMPWRGEVWCNPPYSDVPPWIDRCAEHHARTGHEVLLLVNVSTSVRWFKRHRPGRGPAAARTVAFFEDRIGFLKNGAPRDQNNRDQMLLWWGSARRLRHFRRVFGRSAWVVP